MSKKKLIIEDDVLLFKDGSKIIIPSAKQIVSWAHPKEGYEVPHMPDLNYSKFPLELKIKPQLTKKGMKCDVIGATRRKEIKIKNPLSLSHDHLIHEGYWYPLLETQLDHIKEIIVNSHIENLEKIELGHYTNLLENDAEYKFVLPIPEDKLDPSSFFEKESLKLDTFEGELYPYQVQGSKWLISSSISNTGGILGDEMGLGKTLQLIFLFCYEKSKSQHPNLVICPSTLIENWFREIQKFAPSLKVSKHRGYDRTGSVVNLKNYDVIICSYETAISDRILFKNVEWNILVLDEAQYIKNPSSNRTNHVKTLKRRIGIAVSGTPVEKKLKDLWSIVDFIRPDYLGDLAQFEEYFVDRIENAKVLKNKIKPLMMRRKIKDVLDDLPDKIEKSCAIEMDSLIAEYYEDKKKEYCLILSLGPILKKVL